MEENKKNENLQSRREFFKKAAKGALPIIAGVVLASVPHVINASTKTTNGCQIGCYGGCSHGCETGCQGCQGGCNDKCAASCTGGCKNTCWGTCKGSCTGKMEPVLDE